MVSYKMTSKINLNNRNAFELLDILRDYDGAVYIEKISEQRQANANSLLGLLSLSVVDGDEISIHFDNAYVGYEKIVNSLKKVFYDVKNP